MLIFSQPLVFDIVVVMHYFLIGVTAWMIFSIFRPLFTGTGLPVLIALLFNLSLSTLFYANFMATEILTIFFLTSAVYWLLRIYEKLTYRDVIILSVFLALLSLARYNAIPLVVTFTLLLGYFLYRNRITLSKSVYYLVLFLVPYLLIINLWCLYNYKNNDFYGLFPRTSGVPRNAVVSSIHPGNEVSEGYKPVLEIFLDAREQYFGQRPTRTRGSLAKFDVIGLLDDLYSGYPIYLIARSDLREHFGITEDEGEYEMGLALSGFYREIYDQNRAFMLKMRFTSFFSGFRAAGTSLPVEYGSINTNVLPSFVFAMHKVGILFISVFVFCSVFVFLWETFRNKFRPNIYLLIFFAVVFSFWGINFYFITANDANRFTYPAEPFIFGLFVYYGYESIHWLKTKYKSNER